MEVEEGLAHESGEGELSEAEAAPTSAPATARGRAEKSLRERYLTAYSEAAFPAFPEGIEETPFALPAGFVEETKDDVPESARKWCAQYPSRRLAFSDLESLEWTDGRPR